MPLFRALLIPAITVIGLTTFGTTPAPAQDAAVKTLDTLVVSGTTPGPGMWRVSRGENTLWILGELKPSPAAISWDSSAVLETVKAADLILWKPYFSIDVDAGFFKKVSLLYSFRKAQQNPDGKRLEQVLDADTYLRWQRLRDRCSLRRRGLENQRPFTAADSLLDAAIRQRGMNPKGVVPGPIVEVVKANGIRSHSPRYMLKLSGEAASEMLAQARRSTLNDVTCLTTTMDLVENGMDRVVGSANAWATGDVDRIDMTLKAHRDRQCTDAFSSAPVSRSHGVPDLRLTLIDQWLTAAEQALADNATTVSVLPVEDVLAEDGYIARLRALGYEIEAP